VKPGVPVTLRALLVPAQSNPYQGLLARALEAQGVAVRLGAGPRRFPILPLVTAWLRAGRPDVLHLHWTHRYLRPMLGIGSFGRRRTAFELRFLRSRGVRVVWTVHNVDAHEALADEAGRAAHAAIASAADAIICHCEAARDLVVQEYRLGPGLRARIHVVPHGSYADVYPDTLDRTSAREALGLRPHERAFLSLGRIRPYKGIEDLLDAFRVLDRDDARLVVAGDLSDPALEAPLRRHAGEDPRITLLPGHVPDERMHLFLRAADVAVLPYRDVLTSGSAILALTFGLPVVAPRIGCLPETLDGCSIMYDPERPDGLLGALEAALDADLSALGERAAAAAAALGWGPIGARTAALYRGEDTGA
jgi:glycosyltransferase involved in cell wall biosynthesis